VSERVPHDVTRNVAIPGGALCTLATGDLTEIRYRPAASFVGPDSIVPANSTVVLDARVTPLRMIFRAVGPEASYTVQLDAAGPPLPPS
jgi:hypothetical protein